MSVRDELADLIEDTLGTGYGGRVAESAADAILARWVLTPACNCDEPWPDATLDLRGCPTHGWRRNATP